MQYLITFIEGIVSFLSPCILPMLPIYISYFAGSEIKNAETKKKALIHSASFVAGFTVIFVLLGVFAGSIGIFLKKYRTVVNILFGMILILFGLYFFGILKWKGKKAKQSGTKIDVHHLTSISSFLFGMIFAISWTPCIGVFLGTALMMASTAEHVLEGILLLLSFSLGLGLPFIISSVLLEQLSKTFGVIKKHYEIITKIAGILLIILGILMMTGYLDSMIKIFL